MTRCTVELKAVSIRTAAAVDNIQRELTGLRDFVRQASGGLDFEVGGPSGFTNHQCVICTGLEEPHLRYAQLAGGGFVCNSCAVQLAPHIQAQAEAETECIYRTDPDFQ